MMERTRAFYIFLCISRYYVIFFYNSIQFIILFIYNFSTKTQQRKNNNHEKNSKLLDIHFHILEWKMKCTFYNVDLNLFCYCMLHIFVFVLSSIIQTDTRWLSCQKKYLGIHVINIIYFVMKVKRGFSFLYVWVNQTILHTLRIFINTNHLPKKLNL